jgi:predicted MFS family arabinose efflux permease
LTTPGRPSAHPPQADCPARRLSSGIGVGLAAGASVVGFILDAHGPRVGYAFAAACGAASAAICLLGLSRLRSPQVPD